MRLIPACGLKATGGNWGAGVFVLDVVDARVEDSLARASDTGCWLVHVDTEARTSLLEESNLHGGEARLQTMLSFGPQRKSH